jgi:hypothetical protein
MRQKRAAAWVPECGTKLVSQPFPRCRWVHLCGWPEPVTPLRGEARRPAQPRPTVCSGLSRRFVAGRVWPPTPPATRTVRPSVSPTPAKVVLRVLARKASTPVSGSTGAPGVRAAEPVWLTPDRPSFTPCSVGALCAAASELFSGLRVRHWDARYAGHAALRLSLRVRSKCNRIRCRHRPPDELPIVVRRA